MSPNIFTNQQIHIIDPGCRFKTGHHFSLNRVICDQAKKRGKEAFVSVNQACDPVVINALRASPVHRSNAYVDFGGSEDSSSVISAINSFNEQFYKDLCTKVGEIGSADRIIMPTINQWLILGAYWWAQQRVAREVPIDVILMLPPTYPFGKKYLDVIEELYTNTFRLWEKADCNVRFLTPGQSITDEYKRLGCHRIETCPLPVHLTNEKKEGKDVESRRDMTTFVFAGDARAEKGSALLPGACRKVSDSGRPYRLVLQSIDFAPENLKSAVEAKQKDIELLGQLLSQDDFLDFLRCGDVTLLPYNPGSYANRTSLIFIESLSVGRPVITCRGSWMAKELENCAPGSGFTINFTEDDLANSMIRAIDRVEEIRKTAHDISSEIRKRHGADRFGEFLLGA